MLDLFGICTGLDGVVGLVSSASGEVGGLGRDESLVDLEGVRDFKAILAVVTVALVLVVQKSGVGSRSFLVQGEIVEMDGDSGGEVSSGRG